MGKYSESKGGRPFLKGLAPGFTLVELLIGMVVGSIAMVAIYSTYASQTETYNVQREVAYMQQNLRAAMSLIKNDLRNSGRIGLMNGSVGITDVGRFNPDGDDANGYPGITMTACVDGNLDGQAEPANMQQISYQVRDWDGDGRRELRRQVIPPPPALPGGWDLIFDGVEDIGFAYAVDNNNDMDLDRAGAGAGAAVIWGMNTDTTTGLDTNSDSNADGDITVADDADANRWITSADGGALPQIRLEDIRAVRVWLLARSRQAYTDYVDNNVYILGHKVLNMADPANANRRNFRHRLLSGAVALQNHERRP